MNRPYLVNFSAIVSGEKLSVRANITEQEYTLKTKLNKPIESIGLFNKNMYRIKLIGLNVSSHKIWEKEYETDNYGNLELQISHSVNDQPIQKMLIYETSCFPGLEIHLGSFLPLVIKDPKKILITDFDKTLVDTKYSSAKELYYSLSKPINYFPSVEPSLEKLHHYLACDFQPFILSASPHFYEKAIRDWLYQNQIFASNIFLKDYRDFISLFDGSLSAKDLKTHGFYKLNQLVDILLMTGIPDHLILFGDGFETDPFIYLILKSLMVDQIDPWKLWKSLKNHQFFHLNSKQDSFFLTKFNRLSELSKAHDNIEFKIYIRATQENIEGLKNKKFTNQFIENKANEIDYYIA